MMQPGWSCCPKGSHQYLIYLSDGGELDALLVPALEAVSLRDAVSEVTGATGLSRRKVYDRALMLNKNKKNPNEESQKKERS